MIKTLNKLGLEENFLNLVKGIYKKPIASIILNGERLHALPLRSRIRCDICSRHSRAHSKLRGREFSMVMSEREVLVPCGAYDCMVPHQFTFDVPPWPVNHCENCAVSPVEF